ncbi:glycerophosphodiester phosphodiesterase family protein [Minwuia sp.]|uniref:glycerophosphodiester phosphodiesterase family protein n=1 Tax=Minwuia sp. TaxID=2493630 RepID=UPI003A8DAEA9
MTLPHWMTGRPIAHRGLHHPGPGCPENSLAALAAACAGGYATEIDVQLTADGEVVIFHDYSLKRLTGQPGRVAERRWTDMARLRLKGGMQHPPLLTDALQRFPDLPFLIELKMGNPDLAPAVAAILDTHTGPFAVQSFDPDLVRWFARHRPEWPRGLIAYESLKFSLSAREPRYRPEFLQYCDPHFAAWNVKDLPAPAAVSERLPVLTWTVRTASDRRRAELHASNMIFEGFRP